MMTNVTSHFLLDAASRLFMQIGILCPIFSEYELLYPDSVRLQSALKNYYASIIRCCRHLVESFGRPCEHHLRLNGIDCFSNRLFLQGMLESRWAFERPSSKNLRRIYKMSKCAVTMRRTR